MIYFLCADFHFRFRLIDSRPCKGWSRNSRYIIIMTEQRHPAGMMCNILSTGKSKFKKAHILVYSGVELARRIIKSGYLFFNLPWMQYSIYKAASMLVGWSNSFRNPLQPHLSDVRLGGAVSDHFFSQNWRSNIYTHSALWLASWAEVRK